MDTLFMETLPATAKVPEMEAFCKVASAKDAFPATSMSEPMVVVVPSLPRVRVSGLMDEPSERWFFFVNTLTVVPTTTDFPPFTPP
jgi:hypothetical protein